MKQIVIKSMVVLSLVMAGTVNTTNVMAQTQESQQVEEFHAFDQIKWVKEYLDFK